MKTKIWEVTTLMEMKQLTRERDTASQINAEECARLTSEIERLRAALVKIKKHWEGIEAMPVSATYQEVSRMWRAMYKELEDIAGDALNEAAPAVETKAAP